MIPRFCVDQTRKLFGRITLFSDAEAPLPPAATDGLLGGRKLLGCRSADFGPHYDPFDHRLTGDRLGASVTRRLRFDGNVLDLRLGSRLGACSRQRFRPTPQLGRRRGFLGRGFFISG